MLPPAGLLFIEVSYRLCDESISVHHVHRSSCSVPDRADAPLQVGEALSTLDTASAAVAARLPRITAASSRVLLSDGASAVRLALAGANLGAPGTAVVARCSARQLFLPVSTPASGGGGVEVSLPLAQLPPPAAATGAQVVWLEAALGAYLSAAVPVLVVHDAAVAAAAARLVPALHARPGGATAVEGLFLGLAVPALHPPRPTPARAALRPPLLLKAPAAAVTAGGHWARPSQSLHKHPSGGPAAGPHAGAGEAASAPAGAAHAWGSPRGTAADMAPLLAAASGDGSGDSGESFQELLDHLFGPAAPVC
jgi:hypothetical protein